MADKQSILFPVGRFVGGDLYEGNDTDATGNPLIVKNGSNAGHKRVEYFVQVAIPKDGRQWWETEWGKIIYQVGAAAFPQMVASPDFAWKIKDGDDARPRFHNGKATKPYNQREGWAGHWIVGISSGYAPRIVTADGSAEITEPGAVKRGYWIQVFGNVAGNGNHQKPGVFINHSGIALSGYGQEISSGVDLASVGFGGALPAGASATPIAGMTSVPPQAGAVPGAPGQPAIGFPAGYPAPGVPGVVPGAPGAHQMPVPGGQVPGLPTPGAAPGLPAAPMAAAGVPAIPGVAPNPAFLSVPGAPAAPVAPVAPPAAPVRTMTAAANGATYESFRAAGWTDAQMVQAGYMQA